jgi:WD40 repeat protein
MNNNDEAIGIVILVIIVVFGYMAYKEYTKPEPSLKAIRITTTIPFHTYSDQTHVHRIEFNNYKGLLATAGWEDNTVRLFDVRSGTELYSFTHDKMVTDIAFDDSAKYLASSDIGGRVRVLDLETGQVAHEFDEEDSVCTIAFGNTSEYLIIGRCFSTGGLQPTADDFLGLSPFPSEMTKIRFRNLKTGEKTDLAQWSFSSRMFDMCIVPHTSTVALALYARETYVQSFTRKSRTALKLHYPPQRFTDVDCYSGELGFGPFLVATTHIHSNFLRTGGSGKDGVILWDITEGAESEIRYEQPLAAHVTISPNGRYVAAGSIDTEGTLTLMDMEEEELFQFSSGHPVASLVFCPNSECLLIGSEDEIKLVEVAAIEAAASSIQAP